MENKQDFVITKGVLEKYKGSGGDVTIPEGVTKIGHSTFFACVNLTSVTIPEGVTEIGNDAFRGCKKLTIHAPAGSAAEQYAKKNKIPFETTVK